VVFRSIETVAGAGRWMSVHSIANRSFRPVEEQDVAARHFELRRDTKCHFGERFVAILARRSRGPNQFVGALACIVVACEAIVLPFRCSKTERASPVRRTRFIGATLGVPVILLTFHQQISSPQRCSSCPNPANASARSRPLGH
jgi:hypothetical protein